jgi:hypothetical protein
LHIKNAQVIGYCNLTKPFDLAFAIVTKYDAINLIALIFID